MTKWKCTKSHCYLSPCFLETKSKKLAPNYCPLLTYTKPEWEKQEWAQEGPTATTTDTLPDWCKVGEWVWIDPKKDPLSTGYMKIEDIDRQTLRLSTGSVDFSTEAVKQARIRPWTFEEAPIVLKVKDSYSFALAYLSPFGEKYSIAFHYPDEKYEKMKLGEVTYTFSSCADLLTQIDGSPCGVLEHLENGEWVK